MRTALDIIVIVLLFIGLYFNLTVIPQQDYVHYNNPWARSVTIGEIK